MKIIKSPEKIKVKVECYCGCEYIYNQYDVKQLWDERDRKLYYYVECPICGVKKWIKK